jgi:phosphatidate cytidylyltransferase
MNITSELKKRILTGTVGGIFLLALILIGEKFGIFLFASILSLGLVFEFTEMTYSLFDKIEKRYVLLSITWLIALCSFLMPQLDYSILIFSFMSLFAYYLMTAKRFEEAHFIIHFRELAFSIFGLIYLVFIPQYLSKIAELPQGIHWALLFLVIVWSGDTGAYFAGLKYGRRKLYPSISPKKTVEGLMGGLGTGLAMSILCRILFFRHLPIAGVVLIPIFVGIVAQLGDLCESFLKRSFQKKDSGAILPGHGGLLDRFDSVIFSLPIMYGCVKIFG